MTMAWEWEAGVFVDRCRANRHRKRMQPCDHGGFDTSRIEGTLETTTTGTGTYLCLVKKNSSPLPLASLRRDDECH